MINKMKAKKIINAWICQISDQSVKPVFGDIEIARGKIAKITKRNFKDFFSSKKSNTKGNVIDANGAVVTIPLVNFHEHFYSRLAKGLNIKGSTESFIDILENLWWKLDRVLTLEMISASVEMGVAESIKNGVTYIFDHHASPNAIEGSLSVIADALENKGLRGTLCFEGSDRNGKKASDKSLDENKNFAANCVNDNIKAMLGLHASFTVSDETLAQAKKIQDELGLGVHIHLCEDKADRTESKKKFGNYPVQRLAKRGLLNEKSILAHGIHLTKNEYDLIAKSGAAIAFNPDSNLNNAVGFPDFEKINLSIPLLMGTDGMHANPGRSLKNIFLLLRADGFSFEETFTVLNKIYFDQINFVKSYFPDYPDLSEGDRADFVIWDYVPPTPLNSANFFGHYIYGILERAPKYVIQNGEILLKEKNLTNIDEAKANKFIYAQGEKLARKFSRMK